MGGVISKVTAGGATHVVTSSLYGTCTTAAATAAKIVILTDTNITTTDWLVTGLVLYVKFTNSNTAANPTITIQSGASGNAQLIAAKSIKRYGTTASSTSAATSWTAGAVVPLIYDGTNWIEASSWDNDTNTTYSAATTSTAGLMSAADKTKLDGIEEGAGSYTLPAATSSTLGGVKIGSNITNSSGTISLTKTNVTSALGYTPPTTDTNTTYSAGTGISLSGTTFSNSGVRSIATGSSNGTISVNTNGTSADVSVKGLGSAAYTASSAYATSGHTHNLSLATSTGTSSISLAANTKYQLTAGGKTYIFTTPADTNTTYTASTTTVGSASTGTAIPADDITSWTTNTPTTISYTARSIPNVTSVGSRTIDQVSFTATSTDNGQDTTDYILGLPLNIVTNVVVPTLGTAISADDITAYSKGTAANLSYTAKSIPNISVSNKTVATGITAS